MRKSRGKKRQSEQNLDLQIEKKEGENNVDSEVHDDVDKSNETSFVEAQEDRIEEADGDDSNSHHDKQEEEDDDLPLSAKKGRKRSPVKTDEDTDASPTKKKKSKKARSKGKRKQSTKSQEEGDDDDDQSYQVEKIVDKRERGGVTEYLIRWKGFTSDSDTWEEESSLSCPEKLKEFLRKGENGVSPGKRGRPAKGKKLPMGSKTAKKKKSGKSGTQNEDDDDSDSVSKTDEYEVEKIVEVHNKKNGEREFLVRWKGYSKEDDTWEPESRLNCPDLLKAFLSKVDKAKEATQRETRVNRKQTSHFTMNAPDSGRKLSKRHKGPRLTYTED